MKKYNLAAIDAAVAEKVMGWTTQRDDFGRLTTDSPQCRGLVVGYDYTPSTDTEQAMEVLKDITGAGYYQLDNGWRLDKDGNRVAGHTCRIVPCGPREGEATADTPAIAICLAALMVDGDDITKYEEDTK